MSASKRSQAKNPKASFDFSNLRSVLDEAAIIAVLDLLKGAFKEGDEVTVDVDKKTDTFIFANKRR